MSLPERGTRRGERLHLGDPLPGFSPRRKPEPPLYCGRSRYGVTYWAAPSLEATPDFLPHIERCGTCLRVAAARERA